MAREEQGSTLYNGQVSGPNLANADECRHRLMIAFGDMAGAIMNAAKIEYDKLPAKVRRGLMPTRPTAGASAITLTWCWGSRSGRSPS